MGLLVAVAAGHLLWRCAQGGEATAARSSLARPWLFAAVALPACLTVQELLEGALALIWVSPVPVFVVWLAWNACRNRRVRTLQP